MLAPPLPEDEIERLAALEKLGILYTPAEERFDRITRLASRILQVPIALVSLIGKDVQWFKSRYGLDVAETSREISFCGHAILGDDTLLVADATQDERFCDNPLVTGAPSIRFYAGHPLRSSDGRRLGTLCVIDRTPRQLTQEDHQALQDLAAIAETELNHVRLAETQQQLIAEMGELRRKALVDPLTGLWNRWAITDVLHRDAARARRAQASLAILLLDVDHFKRVNDSYGHPAGDRALGAVAGALRAALRGSDAIGRWGGEEFLVVLPGCGESDATLFAERVRRCIESLSIPQGSDPIHVTVSVGVAAMHAPSQDGVEAAVIAADKALYRAKRGGRNRVEVGKPSVSTRAQA